MENNNNNGRKPPLPKKLPKERVFAGNTITISEDEASKLIGGIIEKGISEKFTTPLPSSSHLRPSTLPFPVARHRSHGPHWTPAASMSGRADDDNNDEDDVDNDLTNFEPLADFAIPTQRKKKKGLDFSNWKELVGGAIVSNVQEKDKNKSLKEAVQNRNMDEDTTKITNASSLGDEEPMSVENKDELPSDVHESQLGRLPYNDVDMETEEFYSTDMVASRGKNLSATLGPSTVGSGQGHMSIESQIDAENRALLERMSADEIAEAQAEIRNRIKPELLNILKKRGVQKLEKPKFSRDTGTEDVIVGDKQAGKHETRGESKLSALESPTMHNTQVRSDEGAVENSPSKGSSIWDTWSKRVEAIRNLRFSLDGNVIKESSLGSTYTADNVGERDFLRTEGDPGAAGYTIKEALALARSVIPGQRALALHLIASALNKALVNICKSEPDCTTNVNNEMNLVDWEAIWAYALGPEPELVLCLRLAIDDNHNSVVLASAKVIQCLLACDLNEDFFNSTAKLSRKNLYTAPVFRRKPDIQHGFLGGGFWKYSTKLSNIIHPNEEPMDGKNEEHTIQDDNVVAGQDVAAGLVRMEILPRLCYLLETEPTAALEECILSILVAIARHSPTCANAIWKCERLLQTIVDRFNMKDSLELQASKIKSVTLLRVLAQSSRTICVEFINKGFFQIMTLQLYRVTPSIKEWLKSGRESSRLASELMVEQLRFWKVCIMYGHCISSFTGFFPALCLWLSPPTFDKLSQTNLFNEFASTTTEVYLVLEALASRLPDLCSQNMTNQQFMGHSGDELETWCWSDVRPMVDSALQWLDTTSLVFLRQLTGVNSESAGDSTYASSLLWILSAVMHFLSTVLIKATPIAELELEGSSITGKGLPEFVSKIALQIITNDIVDFSERNEDGCSTEHFGTDSLVEMLCKFRHQPYSEAALASVWCLNMLICVVVSADHLIQRSADKVRHNNIQGNNLGKESRILQKGLLKCSLALWTKVLSKFMDMVTSEWHCVRRIEVFGRGGPAPGVGVGWGACDGGFWSLTVATVQSDARMLIELLGDFYLSPVMGFPEVNEKFMMQSINSALASSFVMGPGDNVVVQKVLDILLQVPVLKYMDNCIRHFLQFKHEKELLKGDYTEGDLRQFGKILVSHYTNRWLAVKKKKPTAKSDMSSISKTVNMGGNSLATIPEDKETSDAITMEDNNSLSVEWARQRMPFPSYWFLSPLTTISNITSSDMPNTSAEAPPGQHLEEFLEVAQAGLFFLMGIEVTSSRLSDEDGSLVRSVPLIWRLHSLSVPLLVSMGLLEDDRSRAMYEALQNLYGQYLDELPFSSTTTVGNVAEASPKTDLSRVKCLRFQSEIHENYSSFIETLVEQFAAISYGDLLFGRQIAIYLHRQVESSVRLATWNALSNARALELLPPLDKCLSRAEGYLEPIEEDDGVLEAYVKAWVTGSLDRGVKRGSLSYTIALHHLSSFLFYNSDQERLLLRNKLVKSLLRDYSRKQQHEEMMQHLVQYNCDSLVQKYEYTAMPLLQRFELLKEACEGNSQLLREVDKLQASISNK